MRKTRSKAQGNRRRKRNTTTTGELRLTPQRKAVLRALAENTPHPTVRELHELAQHYQAGISLATIYNSLQALQKAGLINEHNISGSAARYSLNNAPRIHLLEEKTGNVLDVKLKEGVRPEDMFELPEGAQVTSMRAYLYGNFPAV